MIIKDITELHADLRESTKKNIPFSTTWELTYRCPNNCLYCYQKTLREKSTNELSCDIIINTLTRLSNMGCRYVTFSGGDPLLHDSIKEIILATKELGLKVNIYTSGISVSEEILQILANADVENIEITILGSNSETNDMLMGKKGSFNMILNNVSRLVKNNINVILKTTLLKQNIHEYDSMRLLANRLTGNDLIANTRLLCQYEKRDNMIVTLGSTISQLKLFFENNRELLNPYERKKVAMCEAGISTIGITPTGDVLPCSMFLNEVPFGNIVNNNIEEIWEGSLANKFRNKYKLAGIYPQDQCVHCDDNCFCDMCPGIASWNKDSSGKFGHMCTVASVKHKCYETK